MSDYNEEDDLFIDEDDYWIEFIDADDDDGEDYDDYHPYNQPSEHLKHKDYKSFIISEIISYIKVVVVAVIITFVFTQFIIVNAEVPSGSMRDTIWEKDRLIGSRLAYLFEKPQRGDVIIFKYPDDEKVNYVKRIIGLPNDTVQIIGGHVFINGSELDEPYIKEYIFNDGQEYTYVIPEDCYFMLGDNRNNSKDSRYWNNTFVHKSKIIAKVLFRYYSGEVRHVRFSLIK